MPEPRRVLLDENVDRQLKPLFDAEFEVLIVRERGWNGLKNGALLRAAAEEFDVFVTMDRNLPHQQNLKALDLAVVVIRSVSNSFVDVAPLMQDVNAAVRQAVAWSRSHRSTLTPRAQVLHVGGGAVAKPAVELGLFSFLCRGRRDETR